MKHRWEQFLRRTSIYHIYFRRSGFYSTLKSGSVKLLVILALFLAAILAFEHYVGDVGTFFEDLLDVMSRTQVLLLFYISESLLGMIPPDFFILWVKNFPEPIRWSLILGVISLGGGFTAYLIGRRLSYTKRINRYLNTRFRKHFDWLNKWGGFFLVLSALFPFPFATASLLAGMVRFPLGRFFLFGWTRILRFYLYALVLFKFT
jgi:membrane protein DedA with SNARE-associated domain